MESQKNRQLEIKRELLEFYGAWREKLPLEIRAREEVVSVVTKDGFPLWISLPPETEREKYNRQKIKLFYTIVNRYLLRLIAFYLAATEGEEGEGGQKKSPLPVRAKGTIDSFALREYQEKQY